MWNARKHFAGFKGNSRISGKMMVSGKGSMMMVFLWLSRLLRA